MTGIKGDVMKKSCLLALFIYSAVLPMDHANSALLTTEQKIITIVNDSVNPLQAVDGFYQLIKQNNGQLSDTDVYTFLTRASNKYADQEIRLARLINNKSAQFWLSKARPFLLHYQPIEPSEDEFNKAFTYIQNRQHSQLKQWLNQGFDPNARNEDISLLFKAIKHSDLDAIKNLVEYGADVNQAYKLDSDTIQTPLAIIKIFQNLGMGNGHVYQLIGDYIRKQGGHE